MPEFHYDEISHRKLQTEISRQIRFLIDCLSFHDRDDSRLHQLWLEAHWLESDCEQNVLKLPANWDLIVSQIATGNEHRQITSRAIELRDTIRSYLMRHDIWCGCIAPSLCCPVGIRSVY